MFVAGVGHTNFDLLYYGIDRIPNEGEEIYSKGFDLQLGGGVPATMINLSRLGIKPKFCTFLGTDIFSNYVKEQFDKHHIDYINLYHGEGIPLSITSAIINKNDRAFISYLMDQHKDAFTVDQIYKELTGAKIVDMQFGYLEVYKRLKAEGTVLVFDVGWNDGMSVEQFKEYLELADFFTPNKKEALEITGTDNVSDAAKRLGEYFDEVIIKLDSDGCLYVKDDLETIIPPLMNIKKVDSTGAGDAFLSGFIYGLYHGYSTMESIIFGNVTGGVCVEGIGCLSSYVDEKGLFEKAESILKLIKVRR